MLQSTALVAAMTTGHKIGLGVVAAVFILFALVSSFVLPRLSANFPGRGLAWYVALSIVVFAAMIAAVIVLGKEKKETEGTTTSSTPPAATTGGGGGGGGTSTTAGAPQGDPQAGKTVFTSAGCTGCHTLKAAGATGTVGPNLDQLKPAYPAIVHQVEVGGGPMPAFKNSLSSTQIHDVAAFVYTSTHS